MRKLKLSHQVSIAAAMCIGASLNASIALADDPTLPVQQPSEDMRTVNTLQTSETPLLNGQVSKADRMKDGADQDGQAQTAVAQPTPLDSLRSRDQSDFDAALRKVSPFSLIINGAGGGITIGQRPQIVLRKQHATMSPEEFRKLEYGVLGMETIVYPGTGQAGQTVKKLYPTCPAANAGMQVDDLIVKANNYVFRPGDGQRVLWQIVGGKADTPIDITVLRNGELITFHMMRMNIEDIQDNRIRSVYEALLSQLGPPQGE